jgi:Icc-related predicted phosphoesterase
VYTFKHVGLEAIREFVEENEFKLVICGHIHEGSGLALYKKTLIVNPGSKRAFINKKKVLPFLLLETDEELSFFRWLLYNWNGKFEGEIEV